MSDNYFTDDEDSNFINSSLIHSTQINSSDLDNENDFGEKSNNSSQFNTDSNDNNNNVDNSQKATVVAKNITNNQDFNQIPIDFIENTRGGLDLLMQNYILQKHRKNTKGTINYKCRIKTDINGKSQNCPASITLTDTGKYFCGSNDHNHEPLMEIELDMIELRRNLKLKVKANPKKAIKQLYTEILRKFQNENRKKYTREEMRKFFPKYGSIQAGLHKFRKKIYHATLSTESNLDIGEGLDINYNIRYSI